MCFVLILSRKQFVVCRIFNVVSYLINCISYVSFFFCFVAFRNLNGVLFFKSYVMLCFVLSLNVNKGFSFSKSFVFLKVVLFKLIVIIHRIVLIIIRVLHLLFLYIIIFYFFCLFVCGPKAQTQHSPLSGSFLIQVQA